MEGTLILFEQFGDSKRWYGKQHSNELELICFWKIVAHAFSQKKKMHICCTSSCGFCLYCCYWTNTWRTETQLSIHTLYKNFLRLLAWFVFLAEESSLFQLSFFLNFISLFNFTILYWFCHILTWIRHRYTCVPHPEPSSLLPPRTIPLGRPSASAPSIQYHASNLDWRLITYMILYMFQCHYSVMMLSETYLGKLAKKKKNPAYITIWVIF